MDDINPEFLHKSIFNLQWWDYKWKKHGNLPVNPGESVCHDDDDDHDYDCGVQADHAHHGIHTWT